MTVGPTNDRGVPWSKVHFKAGASAHAHEEHPQVNPWTPGTHAFDSWRAGYESVGGEGTMPIKISVNGTWRPLHKQDMISYNDVLFMAGMSGAKGLITVTYNKADEEKPDGILAPGDQHIKVKEGTIFNTADTSGA